MNVLVAQDRPSETLWLVSCRRPVMRAAPCQALLFVFCPLLQLPLPIARYCGASAVALYVSILPGMH
jgi:hypothetical protein